MARSAITSRSAGAAVPGDALMIVPVEEEDEALWCPPVDDEDDDDGIGISVQIGLLVPDGQLQPIGTVLLYVPPF
jgi:hypothetical protein